MRYQKCYTLSYALLIAVTLFAPEKYGVTLKYVLIPLVLMLLFGIAGKGISLRLKFKPHFFVSLIWLLVIIYSTVYSDVVSWSPGARSFCVFVLAFVLLYDIVPDDNYIDKIKRLYIYLTIFCALWIVLQSFGGIDRKNFQFVAGKKDVNVFAAFMLPGIYMLIRLVVFEKQQHKMLQILGLICSVFGLLLLQSRASFITFLIAAALCFVEYVIRNKLSRKKMAVIVLACAIGLLVIGFIWTNPAFSRLTNTSGYEDDIRLKVWEAALEAYRRNPAIGSGIDACNHFSKAELGLIAHNYYIEILGGSGIVGMCLFLLLSWQLLRVPRGERLHMFSFYVVCMLPLGFINGLQTISSWLPLLLLAHERAIIKRRAKNDRHDHLTS